jgi:hypothetical protein
VYALQQPTDEGQRKASYSGLPSPSFHTGKRARKAIRQAPTSTKAIRPNKLSSTHAEMPRVTTTKTMALDFTPTGSARRSRQAFKVGPNTRCLSNHSRKRGSPRAKQAAANRRKGVVGNNGRTAPAPPRPTQAKPATSHTRREARLDCTGSALSFSAEVCSAAVSETARGDDPGLIVMRRLRG